MTTGDDGDARQRPLAALDDQRANCGVGVVMNLDGERSHDTLADGLELLANLEHRGTTGAEADTGDGAGVCIDVPHEFFADEVPADLPALGKYAVGSLFLPTDETDRERVRETAANTLRDAGLDPVAWRDVPTDASPLGATARESEPHVAQVFCIPTDDVAGDALDRRCYVARRAVETAVPDDDRCYVCSLDPDTVVYKGLLTATQLGAYYPDLRDDRVRTKLAMVHARFSTNTLGAWHLAHPHRRLVHNGEFNTLRGNVNWMRAREADLASPVLGDDLDTVRPVVTDPDQSDSASVADVLDCLTSAGRDLPHVLRMLVPEAWRTDQRDRSADRRDWYDFHASLVEPWDGPALVAATDGDRVGAVLDRNGLRPCRYDVLADGTLVLASEVGALDHDPSEVRERGRLRPGELFLADTERGRVVPDDEVFDDLTADRYGDWLDAEQVALADLDLDAETPPPATVGPASGADDSEDDATLRARQALFGYTHDELDHLLEPMADAGKDPVGSMGDDTPLAGLAEADRPLASYFRQLFAQVTNPPLDYERESLVTSLETRLGTTRNLLGESPAHARQLVLDSPILTDEAVAAVRDPADPRIDATVLDATYDPDARTLAEAVAGLRERAAAAVDDADVLVLSDRDAGADRLPIPSLLATAGVHHHLVREGRRARVGLVVDSGDPRTVHQVATLLGYGAGAVCPHLAYRTVEDCVAGPDGPDADETIAAYVEALEDGVRKTMAKMGISTLQSYQGAQVFEAVGLDPAVVDEYFAGTENRTGGIDLADLESDLRVRHATAYEDGSLARTGEFEHRSSGVPHQWNPTTVGTLQQAVREGDYDTFREFAGHVDAANDGPATLRGLLEFDADRESLPVEDVEPVDDIVVRFETAAMSLGSLSPEAHENNAVAMNQVGGQANTGEGGEPPERFDTERECGVKQVASGRFGVTAPYLAAADELQIKMAQGSKPGEGGHLPGAKVNEMIADVRCATPGVGLISPPPQHDIYSIEDLKQVIHDLRAANPDAEVGVKLVSEAGIGTVAAGVAKAGADVIHVSGHSGGTGASAKTSIKHAGLPWELGLAETTQLLTATGLRDRVRVTVDGGLRTGRDVAVGAALGAEGFAFGTASLVSSGCVMARQCHENTCPVGIATQDEDLRTRFPGDPRNVANYVRFVAREVREILADLGLSSLNELVGRVDLLAQREDVDGRADRLDIGGLLATPADGDHYAIRDTADRPTRDRDEAVPALDQDVLDAVGDAVVRGEHATVERAVENEDRSVGATLSNHVVTHHGPDGLPDDTLHCRYHGTAGQSFGAFLAPGVTLDLTGAVNDYLGKGLSGGRVVVRTPADAGFEPAENVVAGNVALYGATDGECYVEGAAGERFAVRNSGAMAVVEGVGDHGCEYMTGGVVVVIGDTGTNFAAGMTGGVAYVHHPDGDLRSQVNPESVTVSGDLTERDETVLRRLVVNHAVYTGSDRADALLDDWPAALEGFVRVFPEEYRRVLDRATVEDVRASPPAHARNGSDGPAGVTSGDD